MIKKINATLSEKLILIFLLALAIFAFSFTVLVKNKCLFVKTFDPQTINFDKPTTMVVLNLESWHLIIELYPELSPKAVDRFTTLIKLNSYDDVAFHRLIKDKLIQAGDLEFGKKNKLNYGKIGTGKSGLGTINSEIDSEFDYRKGSVGIERTLK